MDSKAGFDTLQRFAEVEQLVAKVYFRFSHLFISRPELRDCWWQMGMDEDQHSAILLACREIAGEEARDVLRRTNSREKAEKLESQLGDYLAKGTRSITLDGAFRIALEIENSELDAIYQRLLLSCGPKIAKSLEKLGVPASVQRKKLKSAILRFTLEPSLRSAAQAM